MPAEFEQQPAVDRSKREFAALRALPGVGNMVEQPRELVAGKIGIEQKSGASRDFRFMAGGPQALAVGGGAAVLPDDGRRHRPAGSAIPNHRGLTLIRD